MRHTQRRKLVQLVLTVVATAVVAIGLALMIAGCGAAAEVERAVKSAATFAAHAEPVVVAAYRAEQVACLEKADPQPCVAEVRARWRPVVESYDAFRDAFCAINAIGEEQCSSQ